MLNHLADIFTDGQTECIFGRNISISHEMSTHSVQTEKSGNFRIDRETSGTGLCRERKNLQKFRNYPLGEIPRVPATIDEKTFFVPKLIISCLKTM